MDNTKLQQLLADVASGEVSPASASERLKNLPFEDLGFAKLDHHRSLRRGHGETVFAAGKTPQQVTEIVGRMREHGSNVLVTRCDRPTSDAVLAAQPDAQYHELARCLTLTPNPTEVLSGYVAVVCAGTSDMPVAEEAALTCAFMGNEVRRIHDVGVAGLHRILRYSDELRGANVVVVCAGMEGALPTVVAGLVDKPVIAVPTSVGYGASFGGIAALLGMLNSCAEGVSVVNIDNGFGAGVTAALINRVANGK
ncbi:MAG: nickel pincer cofactor biosynthesis protein LarB [Candidatus Hydrogenedentota bacterium]